MRCPSCGSKVKRGQTRCPSCGEPLVPLRPSFGGAASEVRAELGYSAVSAPAPEQPRRSRRVIVIVVACLAVIAVALVVMLGMRAGARGNGVQISEHNFPDAALRAVVKTYDADDDGALSAEEVAALTSLDCSGRNITSLAGVELLSSLDSLDASDNDLQTADLSHATSLTSVNLSHNDLSSLNLANLGALRVLDVSDNQLTTLELGGCPNLSVLACTGNQLARLDLTSNREVTEVSMDPGQNVTIPIAPGFFPDEGLRASLSSPDVDADGDGALSDRERNTVTRLAISDGDTCDLTGLAWFPDLTSLDVSNTKISSLDAGVLPRGITSIKAEGCQIDHVSLASLSLLISLDVAQNPLTELDMTQLANLTTLDIRGDALTTLDITPVAATLTTLYCDDGITVTGGVARTSAAFPDAALRDRLFSTATNPNGDSLLTPTELSSLTSLDLSGSGVTNLTGVASLPNLQTLNADGLKITSFSCEGLANLQTLYLSGCGLTSIDLTGATALWHLDVSNNALTSLVTTPAEALTSLDATGNPGLASIDVRGCELLDPSVTLYDATTTLITNDDEAQAFETAQRERQQASTADGDAAAGDAATA